MRTQRSWSGAEKRRLEVLLLQGLSNKAIAQALNRSTWSVAKRLFALNLKRPKQRNPVDFTIRLPAELYDELAHCAKNLGMSKGHLVRSTLETRMKRENLK